MEARKWTLDKRFEGVPKLTDFKLVTEKLPPLEDGQILVKAEWLTVDPYMRGHAINLPLGSTLMGHQVARVIESRHPEFPVDTKILGNLGWRDLSVVSPGAPAEQGPMTACKLPDLKGLPDSYALGALGMTGNTAYFGLTRICQPKEGETLVVSAAAGAVGSIVGQIGKILGLKVIGYAGSAEKVEWLKNDLGFDEVFNYKEVDLHTNLQEAAKGGIDIYFDNVGGEFTYNVIRNMNPGSRIALCGAISTYNNDPAKPNLGMPLLLRGICTVSDSASCDGTSHAQVPRLQTGYTPLPMDYFAMIYNRIKMEGFVVLQWTGELLEGIYQLRDWVIEGKLKVKETINEGFEVMPQAFIDLFIGKNTGKQIIKA